MVSYFVLSHKRYQRIQYDIFFLFIYVPVPTIYAHMLYKISFKKYNEVSKFRLLINSLSLYGEKHIFKYK